jgi:type VI protein secretion system component VasK
MDAALLETIAKGGVVLVCLFVIWLGWKREERAAASFEKLNERNQQVQQETVKQLGELNATTRALHEEIRGRPCVRDAEPWNGHDRRHGRERT